MISLPHGKEVSISVFVDGSCNENLKLSLIQELDKKRYIFYDGFSDPLNWEAGSKSSNKFEEIQKFIRQNTSQDTLLVIDDLLMFGRSVGGIDEKGVWKGLLYMLNDLSSRVPLMLFIDPALTDECNIRMLKHISPFSMDILEKENHYICTSRLKKKSGKVLEEKVLLKVIGNQLVVSKDIPLLSIKKINEIDPSSSLTFNLRLSSSEKEARTNTKLPYLFDQETKESFLNKSSDCPVIYQPDEADDFDEEDPDDDLDI